MNIILNKNMTSFTEYQKFKQDLIHKFIVKFMNDDDKKEIYVIYDSVYDDFIGLNYDKLYIESMFEQFKNYITLFTKIDKIEIKKNIYYDLTENNEEGSLFHILQYNDNKYIVKISSKYSNIIETSIDGNRDIFFGYAITNINTICDEGCLNGN